MIRIPRRSIVKFDPEGSEHLVLNLHINEVVNSLSDKGYASMYQDNTETSIVIGATDNSYTVSGMSQGKLEGFSYATNTLTCNNPGIYLAVWSASIQSGTDARDVEGTLFIGSTRQASISSHAYLATKNTPSTLGGNGFLTLLRGDTITFRVLSHLGTSTLAIEHCNLSLLKIDD